MRSTTSPCADRRPDAIRAYPRCQLMSTRLEMRQRCERGRGAWTSQAQKDQQEAHKSHNIHRRRATAPTHLYHIRRLKLKLRGTDRACAQATAPPTCGCAREMRDERVRRSIMILHRANHGVWQDICLLPPCERSMRRRNRPRSGAWFDSSPRPRPRAHTPFFNPGTRPCFNN